jgi:hypothetical protein
MKIDIQWGKPVILAQNKKIVVDEEAIEKIPEEWGVYFFSRKFAKNYQQFYIGETFNLRARLLSHLNNADIRDVLRGMKVPDVHIKHGNKFFHYGVLLTKPGQDAKKCMKIVQKYMIEEAVARGCPLLNKQLTVIRTHSVFFSGDKGGRALFPDEFDVTV